MTNTHLVAAAMLAVMVLSVAYGASHSRTPLEAEMRRAQLVVASSQALLARADAVTTAVIGKRDDAAFNKFLGE